MLAGQEKATAKEDRVRLAGVYPMRFEVMGRYGVKVEWSDGHRSDIFSYEILRSIANDCAR